ncbi:MAG: radical SAM protein, partial [Negativicutes bacterium]|nr:radical SAM protein [Negativicutes bacterium]
ASNYACEFSCIPYEIFIPLLNDDDFKFLEEEELPTEYKPQLMDLIDL